MKRKLKNEKYRYGNYDKYYNERNSSRWNDPRLLALSKEWFEDKEIADVGCNDGTLTILLAINYNPLLIQGIEIDYKLINRAVESIVYIEKCRDQLIQERERISILEELSTFPKSFQSYSNLSTELESLNDPISMKNLIPLTGRFPLNISFLNENYIEKPSIKKYDTILCLSTVKWIHLNWGDQAVKTLFKKIYKSLKNDGIFILEPQPWKSYKKSRTRTEEILKNYHEINFKPQEFNDYLVSLGFELIKSIMPCSQKENFKRTIYVYHKL